MANLSTKIKLYCEANGVSNVDFLKDVLLQNDGSGAYIKEWNVSGLAKPSDFQISSSIPLSPANINTITKPAPCQTAAIQTA